MVDGFVFPLTTEADVERLEAAVDSSATIKRQYIQLLKAKKPKHIDLVDCFPMIFGSSSMEAYTWSGCRISKFPKKAMKNYSIFNGCMLAAWESQEMDIKMLEENIKQAIHRIRRRRLAKTFYDKKKSTSEM
nr:uncharacterized protein LOC109403891 [Aedes albopictus]